MLLSQAGKGSADVRVLQAYEDARDDVYYYVLTLGLSSGQAQDVVQEVFLKLYVQLRAAEKNQRPAGDDIRNERAWVFRVAHNEALKLKAKERHHSEITPEFEPVSGDATPEKQLMESESQRRLQKALTGLSPQQRQVLHLRASGLRYREIAETIGVTTSTVNEFLRRAVVRLRKAMYE
jgi:RNA polymerase sigma-70 factor, ECF subfamily